ncbi:hypothetical protein TTHERM_000118777 (macronuclear) [Tetrahymena thermophila SB210]|uniref:Leucine rich repeat protein n=1 Tax=Tetrahymena thermophila (strain SB210) TaxID=312017 RepID=W7XJQ2_TETTS|nr:hypothetical protein TTHERM_000118777 [Tetrahymena thermophila SB210]EWS75791.1 hypothetical protein TTHERM_000118777 [Tetrahymena thermophila SB210]|eukprot:XP_012651713.1 hypothetical protein TTHERM_000118777 [Tetrahymena thermophila SB210]
MTSLPPAIRDLSYSPIIQSQIDKRTNLFLEKSVSNQKLSKKIIFCSPESRSSLKQIFNSSLSTMNSVDEKKTPIRSIAESKYKSQSPVWENSLINQKLNLKDFNSFTINQSKTQKKRDLNSICQYDISGKSIKISLKKQIKSKMTAAKEANISSLLNFEQISDRDIIKDSIKLSSNKSVQRQSIKSLAYLQSSPSQNLDSSRNFMPSINFKNKVSQKNQHSIRNLKQLNISNISNKFNSNDEDITFLKESENSNLIQKKLGIDSFFFQEDSIESNQNQNVIDFSDKTVSEKFIKIIIQILNRPDKSNFTVLKLKNNNLTSQTLEILFSQLPQQIQEIDLQSNNLGSQDLSLCLNPLSQKSFYSNLKILNLENNNIGDIGFNQIYSDLLQYNLSVLNLSQNCLTDDCMECFSNFLKNTELNELYISQNNITSEGALCLAQGLEGNNSLQVLDLSKNNIGFPQRLNACLSIVNSISNTNSKLKHLDLSYNNISFEESVEISTSIQKNKTLFGIHYLGNEGNWYFDTKGYMKQSEQSEEQEPDIQHQRIQGLQSRKNSQQNNLKNGVCWICDGWVEFTFEIFTQQSSSFCKYPVFLHLQFENYQPCLMEHDPNNPNRFFLTKMCPPNKEILFFFTNIDSKIVYHAKEYQKILFLANEYPEIIFLSKEDKMELQDNSNSIVTPQKTKSVNKFFELQYSGTNVQFQTPLFINKIQTVKSSNLFSNKYESLIKCKPRIEEKIYDITLDNSWSIKTSIFLSSIRDYDDLINKCFEFDWENSKINTILNSFLNILEEKQEVKELFKNRYNSLMNLYKYHSSIGMIGDIPTISQSQFLALANKMKLTDGKLYKIVDIDYNFISAISNTDKERNYLNPEKAVIRFQFLELIVRIICDKYMRKGNCKNVQKAIQKFFDKKSIKSVIEEIEDPQKWRDERFWNEGCEQVLKNHIDTIQEIWHRWADSKKEEKRNLKFQKSMSIYEFTDMVKHFKLLSESFTEKDVQIAFNLSIMIQIDEINNNKFINMSFIEFIEALGRVAEKKILIPLNMLKSIQNSGETDKIKLEYRLELLLNHLKENMQKRTDKKNSERTLKIGKCKSNFILPTIPRQDLPQQFQYINQNFQDQSIYYQMDHNSRYS